MSGVTWSDVIGIVSYAAKQDFLVACPSIDRARRPYSSELHLGPRPLHGALRPGVSSRVRSLRICDIGP
jgi:hypothetical protein